MNKLQPDQQTYVSRGGLKLASVADKLGIEFKDKTVIDVGSSTGGFTDYALKHGAKKVFAIELGTDQLHSSLRQDQRIELHEKTNIVDFAKDGPKVDLILVDVSFDRLANILPACEGLLKDSGQILAMLKPQFEATSSQLNRGIIKNKTIRRDILNNFENWLRQNHLLVVNKADSTVAGAKGNVERFYLLKLVA